MRASWSPSLRLVCIMREPVQIYMFRLSPRHLTMYILPIPLLFLWCCFPHLRRHRPCPNCDIIVFARALYHRWCHLKLNPPLQQSICKQTNYELYIARFSIQRSTLEWYPIKISVTKYRRQNAIRPQVQNYSS